MVCVPAGCTQLNAVRPWMLLFLLGLPMHILLTKPLAQDPAMSGCWAETGSASHQVGVSEAARGFVNKICMAAPAEEVASRAARRST